MIVGIVTKNMGGDTHLVLEIRSLYATQIMLSNHIV